MSVPIMRNVNGYKIMFIPMNNDTFYIKSIINTGFIVETRENSGINHLLEHLITASWKKCNPDECSVFWDKRGIYMNASTTNTTLDYYVHGMSCYAELMTKYIVDITFNPHITYSSLKREKTAVKNELLSYADESVESVNNAFNKTFYTIEGMQHADDWKLQIDNLDRITLSKLLEIYHKYYTCANIAFIVCGKFNMKDLLKMFKHKLKPCEKKVLTRHAECFTRRKQLVFVKQNDLHSSTIRLGFPTELKSNSHDTIYLDVITQSLTNTLMYILRTKHKLIYSVESGYDITTCGTYITIDAHTEPKYVKKVYHFILNTIQSCIDKGIDREFLSGAVQFTILEKKNTQMDSSEVGDHYDEIYSSQFLVESPYLYSLEEQDRAISKMTVQKSKELCRSLFDLSSYTCVYQNTKEIDFT